AVPEGPTPDGSTSRFTLSCPDSGPCTLGPTTRAGTTPSGAVFDCTNTGCKFGTPLEIPLPDPARPLTTCLQTTWSGPASGAVDPTDGASATSVPLFSDVYITGNNLQPCPRCYSGGSHVVGSPSSPASGTCDRGPNAGLPCKSQNSVGLTN